MKKDFCITKHNDLITSAYRLSLTEMQIILYGISLINPMDGRFPRAYEINIKKFGEMFHRKHCEIYNNVKDAVMNKFWEREFTFQDKYESNRLGEVVRVRVKWVTTVKYSDKAWFIKIYFNPEIEDYLHNLKSSFTTYYIKQVSKFRRFYSVRFYEIATMYLNKSKVNKSIYTMPITDIRDILELKEKYSKFIGFKQRVLDPSIIEINDFSDLKLSYEVIKEGRKITAIKFTVIRPKLPIGEHVLINSREEGQYRNRVSPVALEKAKTLALLARTGWDIYAIEEQFYEYSQKKGEPDNIDSAFIGFVKKKVARSP